MQVKIQAHFVSLCFFINIVTKSAVYGRLMEQHHSPTQINSDEEEAAKTKQGRLRNGRALLIAGERGDGRLPPLPPMTQFPTPPPTPTPTPAPFLQPDIVHEIPPLDPRGTDSPNEGTPTDYQHYQLPVGTVRAILLFVDFPNVPSTADINTTAMNIIRNSTAYFNEQSYGKLNLEIDVPNLGWVRMPKTAPDAYLIDDNSRSGGCLCTYDSQSAYLEDVADVFQFASTRIDFGRYDFFFVVAAQGSNFTLSPAVTYKYGHGVEIAGGPKGGMRLGITFGDDVYRTDLDTMNHEIGHLFGAPDLYQVGKVNDPDKVGWWSIMNEIQWGKNFLGWQRHKFGWLDEERVAYMPERTSANGWMTQVQRLSRHDGGLSMIVFPLDNKVNPSKVGVLELAEPVSCNGGLPTKEGLLFYTVDATVETGEFPIVMISKDGTDANLTRAFDCTIDAPIHNDSVYEAGESIVYMGNYGSHGSYVVASVNAKIGTSFNVQIYYYPPN